MNKSTLPLFGLVSLLSLCLLASPAAGQLLYSQDFQVDDTSNWTVNDGPTDEYADFFFDYGAASEASLGHVGIPAAPNSDPGETTNYGMFLQANLFDNVFGGFSVSPNGQSFEGDYALTFDYWGNYIGPLELGGQGQTNLSTYGIMTEGITANYPGSSDAVFFANTLDGGSGADYRAYSSERAVSYQWPRDETVPEDLHATYEAESRNHNDPLYEASFGGAAAPDAQLSLYPSQTEMTRLGVMGMAWHEIEIAKIGDIVTWKVDGTLLVTVDTSEFTIPTGGTNILFGHSDTNSSSSTDINAINLTFTLIDNIEVNTIVPGPDVDLDDDGDVDGNDFLLIQRNDPSLIPAWEAEYGSGGTGLASISTVPEPSALLLGASALLFGLAQRRQRV